MNILRDTVKAQHNCIIHLTDIILNNTETTKSTATAKNARRSLTVTLGEPENLGASLEELAADVATIFEDTAEALGMPSCKPVELPVVVSRARQDLIRITGGDPAATLAELVSVAGEEVASLREAQAEALDMAADRDDVAKARRVLAADLTDLQTMRAMLDQKGYTPDPGGLRALVQVWSRTREERDALIDERDALADGARDLRAELDRLANNLHDSIRERDTLADEVTVLRAQVAALTPGPWVRLGDMDPGDGEKVLMHDGVVGSAPWLQLVDEATAKYLHATYLWRRLPVGLLTPPKTSETVTP